MLRWREKKGINYCFLFTGRWRYSALFQLDTALQDHCNLKTVLSQFVLFVFRALAVYQRQKDQKSCGCPYHYLDGLHKFKIKAPISHNSMQMVFIAIEYEFEQW